SRVTFTPSSKRSRFSSRILSEKGSRATFLSSSAARVAPSKLLPPTPSVLRALNESFMRPPGIWGGSAGKGGATIKLANYSGSCAARHACQSFIQRVAQLRLSRSQRREGRADRYAFSAFLVR